MLIFSTWSYLYPSLHWEISEKNDMNWIFPWSNPCQSPIIAISQIIGFVSKSLSELIQISNKILENLIKMKVTWNVKDESIEELISQSREQEHEYKEG